MTGLLHGFQLFAEVVLALFICFQFLGEALDLLLALRQLLFHLLLYLCELVIAAALLFRELGLQLLVLCLGRSELGLHFLELRLKSLVLFLQSGQVIFLLIKLLPHRLLFLHFLFQFLLQLLFICHYEGHRLAGGVRVILQVGVLEF